MVSKTRLLGLSSSHGNVENSWLYTLVTWAGICFPHNTSQKYHHSLLKVSPWYGGMMSTIKSHCRTQGYIYKSFNFDREMLKSTQEIETFKICSELRILRFHFCRHKINLWIHKFFFFKSFSWYAISWKSTIWFFFFLSKNFIS